MDLIESVGVWEVVDRPQETRVIDARWRDINKGDESCPYCRGRLAAKELKRTLVGGFVVAMPPLTAHRMLVTLAVTTRVPRPMSGCRDAGMTWEIVVARVMKKLGCEQGVSSPRAHYRPGRDVRSLIHEGDPVTLGGLDDLEWAVVVKAALGPPGCPGCSTSTIVLNRVVSWETWGISWETDPWHAEPAAFTSGVPGRKVSAPNPKERASDPLGGGPQGGKTPGCTG